MCVWLFGLTFFSFFLFCYGGWDQGYYMKSVSRWQSLPSTAVNGGVCSTVSIFIIFFFFLKVIKDQFEFDSNNLYLRYLKVSHHQVGRILQDSPTIKASHL